MDTMTGDVILAASRLLLMNSMQLDIVQTGCVDLRRSPGKGPKFQVHISNLDVAAPAHDAPTGRKEA